MQVRRVCLALGVLLAMLLGGPDLLQTESSALLRLHVRANSDAPADQAVKYQVRDAVLVAMNNHLNSAGNAEAAQAQVLSILPEMLETARNTVRAAGFDYPVTATIGTAQFPTRLYGGRVYRAGEYKALQIYLGEGKGQNWWCVLFPPLCFVEAPQGESVPVSGEFSAPPRPRSRLLEWWQRFFSKRA